MNGDVRKTADEITSGAANDEDKLRRLFEYCRTKIKNTQRDVITAEERADTKLNKTPADTINQGAGSGFDIDMAFAALASAAGFDARIARLGDRSASFFSPASGECPFLARLQCRHQHRRQVAFLRSGQHLRPIWPAALARKKVRKLSCRIARARVCRYAVVRA